MKLRVIPIRDASLLQELVLQQLDAVSGQVQILEISLDTDWGPITLGLDRGGQLVGLIANVDEEKALLSQLIGVHRWILINMPLLSRFYAKMGLDNTRNPRIIAIAPEFSRDTKESLAYLAFPVELYVFKGLEIEGERRVLLEEVLNPLGSNIGWAPEPRPVEASDTEQIFLRASHLSEAEVRFLKGSHSSGPTA